MNPSVDGAARSSSAARSRAPMSSGARRRWSSTRARVHDIVRWLHDDPTQRYDYLSDVTAVEFRDLEQPIEVVWHLRSLPFRRFLRVKVLLAKGAPLEVAERVGRLQERRLARARVLRHVRHHVHRPSRPAPHPDVGAVQGGLSRCGRTSRCAAASAAPSSCARRSRRIRKRATPWKSSRSPMRSRICPTTCSAGSAAARRRESSHGDQKRTVEVELSTTGLDAQGRPQRVPLVVDESGSAGRRRGAAVARAGARPVSTC